MYSSDVDKADAAYREWCRTGILTDDDFLVKCLYYRFDHIAIITRRVPEYKLMSDHAYKTKLVLRDILIARDHLMENL